MSHREERAADLAAMWQGSAGRAWVEAQSLLDHTYRPLEAMLADEVAAGATQRVLDVGCGSGATTVAAAKRIGAAAECVGIDISPAMLDAARQRAQREGVAVEFVCADAQSHDFAPARFEHLISRFGIMFFADPVRAFANLRRACAPTAQLSCIVWRSPQENPFMTTAERAAESHLPGVTRRDPDEPGQFGLADRAMVERVLAQSGWRDVSLQAIDVPCAFPGADLELYVGRLGPVGRALADADATTRARVLADVLPAFEPFVHAGEVRFVAACWMIRAR